MGLFSSSSKTRDSLEPLQRQLFNLFGQNLFQRLQGGPFQNQLDPGAFGASDLQNQLFGQIGQFAQNPFGAQGQGALDQLLSGEAAFQLSPELTAQRNELFQQSIAPAQDIFRDELRGLGERFAGLGNVQSGGFLDANAQAAARFGSNLSSQRAGILQGDINASIASQEQARRNQLSGLGLQLGGQQAAFGLLGQFGQQQRGIGIEQAGVQFGNRQRQDPFSDPALQFLFPFIGQRNLFERQSGGGAGSAIGSLLGTGIGAFFGGPGGAAAGGQIGGNIGGFF